MNNRIDFCKIKPILRVMILVMFSGGSVLAQVGPNFSWSRSGAASVGVVRSLLLSPSTYAGTPYILAGTADGGIYRSTDNGATWSHTGLGNLWVQCISSGNSGEIFAGTVILSQRDILKNGLYVSTDGGASWSLTGLVGYSVQSIAVKGGSIFAGTYGSGLFVSTDNDTTWKEVNDSLASYSLLGTPHVTSLLVNGGSLIAGTNGGVFRTTDDGTSWSGDGLRNIYIHALAIIGSGSSGAKMFAATDYGVYVSTVGDTNWTSADSGLTDSSTSDISVYGNNVYVSTASGLFSSTNEGVSWSPVNLGLYQPNILALAANDSCAVAGTSGNGIFQSRDGSNWLAINSNISTVSVAGLAADAGGIYAATSGGVYFSPDSGGTWSPKSYGLTNDQVTAVLPEGNTIYAGTSYGLYVSGDKGETWSVIDSMAGVPITALANDGGTLLAGTSNSGVFTSSDNGATWVPSDSGLTGKVIAGFAVAGGGVFVGVNGPGVFFSTDHGATWSAVNGGLHNQTVTCITTNGSGLLYEGSTKGGPYYAPASSPDWTAAAAPFTGSINAIAANGPYLFAAVASNGVSVSIDTGSAWTAVYNGLPSEYGNIQSLMISGTQVFAGGAGGAITGIWRASLDNILSVEGPSSALPSGFSLSQNYPNPFNPTTVIRYHLPAAGRVALTVYDVLGRQVETLADKVESPGSHEIVFNGADLASGVYFYRLEAGTFSKTKKMLLLK